MLVKKFFWLAFVLISLSSCKQFINGGSQLWLFQSGRTETGNEDTMMGPANFLYLTEDGRYTRDFGVFDYGEWKVKKDKLTLTPANKTGPVVYNLRVLNAKNMVLSLGARASNFRMLPSDGDPDENPFSFKNNTWRIHPGKRESNQQIVDRVRNHCAFWQAYFTWGIKSNLQSMDVRSTPTAIKVYGNGFSLKKYHELPPQWVNCFYDSTDCQSANDKIRKVFRAKQIKWAYQNEPLRMFYSAFKQLGEHIE